MKKLAIGLCSLFMIAGIITGCGTTGKGTETVDMEKAATTEATEVQSEAPMQTEADLQRDNQAEPVGVNVVALKGPTAMGMVYFMDQNEQGNIVNNQYQFSIAAAVDEVTPMLVKGEVDIAAVPANLASVLYNNTEGQVQVMAINTLGVLYLMGSGEEITAVEELKGKTIYASGKGATPEYALNYILSENGINPESDVTIEWKSEHTECLAALLADEEAVAMLPQPFVTTARMKNEKINVIMDLAKEWEKLQESSDTPSALLTGVVVVRKEFADNHPEAVSDFLDNYQQSVQFVNENTAQAAELVGKYEIVTAEVAQEALPYCNITYIDGAEMKEKLSGYLSVLFEQNPKAIGGALPKEDFYFQR
ncbi:MAG: PhnD/SsuA/transferrin family substrate-binding protein [Lachnospiraceae bacterium]|nr:PhnD/SsuA/transferrin family substrate-binding protein [Lachnospiraceae bacterium]